jgi:hypothetical protein
MDNTEVYFPALLFDGESRMTGQAFVELAADGQIGCVAARQLWVAALPLDRAVDAVLAKVPGSAASLSSDVLTLKQVDALRLRAGDVRWAA